MVQKIQKKQDKKKLTKIVPEVDTEVEAAEAPETELDPEILEAISAKKPKKTKVSTDVDYIPELERDTNEFDFDDDL
jgi:hypothetical protein